MKRSVISTIMSLIAILLATIHLSDDIVRGFEPGFITRHFRVDRGATIHAGSLSPTF
jgi:hypothetical protein